MLCVLELVKRHQPVLGRLLPGPPMFTSISKQKSVKRYNTQVLSEAQFVYLTFKHHNIDILVKVQIGSTQP